MTSLVKLLENSTTDLREEESEKAKQCGCIIIRKALTTQPSCKGGEDPGPHVKSGRDAHGVGGAASKHMLLISKEELDDIVTNVCGTLWPSNPFMCIYSLVRLPRSTVKFEFQISNKYF